MAIDLFKKYFPTLTPDQLDKFVALEPFYKEWNEKINVISRKDMDTFMLHHVLHSLTLTKFMNFKPGTDILDLGTGGGFPGIPLAIFFPEVKFHLIDGTGKKILIVNEAIKHLGLKNAMGEHIRLEDIVTKYDFVTARAVTVLGDLIRMVRKYIKSTHQNSRPNGLIAYKGFPLKEESKAVRNRPHELFMISDKFKEEYFEGKGIVYVPFY